VVPAVMRTPVKAVTAVPVVTPVSAVMRSTAPVVTAAAAARVVTAAAPTTAPVVTAVTPAPPPMVGAALMAPSRILTARLAATAGPAPVPARAGPGDQAVLTVRPPTVVMVVPVAMVGIPRLPVCPAVMAAPVALVAMRRRA